MSEMQTFNFEGIANIRAIDKDGMAWFVAGDICKALGFKHTNDATKYLDPDEKGAIINRTLGGDQLVTIVNESGLYSLIFRSRKIEAKQFKKWVTTEVLPSIRKHGGYINGQELLAEKARAEALAAIEAEAESVRRNMRQLREDRDDAHRALRRLR